MESGTENDGAIREKETRNLSYISSRSDGKYLYVNKMIICSLSLFFIEIKHFIMCIMLSVALQGNRFNTGYIVYFYNIHPKSECRRV